MKTVGIITMHRVRNVGSVLQAFALQKTIEDIGYRAEIIDYVYPNTFHNKKNKHLIKIILEKFVHICFGSCDKKLTDFRNKYISLSKKTYKTKIELEKDPPIYDIYVAGSDQIWNVSYTKGDDSFLLAFVKNKPLFSYASSLANIITDTNYVSLFETNLKKFIKIGVRENKSKFMLQELLKRDVYVNCDPTLLLTKKDWLSLLPKIKPTKKKYVLFYVLNYSFEPYPEITKLFDIFKEYEIIFATLTYKDVFRYKRRLHFDMGPLDFIELIYNASYVVTTSFHGTCFSLIFNKNFYSLLLDSQNKNDNRIQTMLDSFNLSDRCLYKSNNYTITKLSEINYNLVNPRIEELRQTSLQYLQETLKECNNE